MAAFAAKAISVGRVEMIGKQKGLCRSADFGLSYKEVMK